MTDLNIDWKDVAGAIAPLAPTLGGLLGGLIPFPGASLAGEALGGIIAKQFGVTTPAETAKAIQSNPNEVVLAKLKAATEEMVAKYQNEAIIEKAHAEVEQSYYEAIGTTVEQVNQTMRVEVQHQHWFFTGWRAASGWIFNFYAFWFGWLLTWATAQTLLGDVSHLTEMQEAWPLYAAFFGILALMVGVYTGGDAKTLLNSVKKDKK